MQRHYVKVPSNIQQSFPGGAPDNWRAAAFEDATEGGTRLTLTTIPGSDPGTRLAVYGDRFYFEVGLDRTALTRCSSRASRGPRARTACRESSIARCGSGRAACRRGSTRSSISSPTQHDLTRTRSRYRRWGRRCCPDRSCSGSWPTLPKIFGRSSDPRATSVPCRPQAELLRVLRTVWARHRLDRVAMPSTRAEALLRSAIHPSVLSAGERRDLLAVVSILALNQLRVTFHHDGKNSSN